MSPTGFPSICLATAQLSQLVHHTAGRGSCRIQLGFSIKGTICVNSSYLYLQASPHGSGQSYKTAQVATDLLSPRYAVQESNLSLVAAPRAPPPLINIPAFSFGQHIWAVRRGHAALQSSSSSPDLHILLPSTDVTNTQL